MHRRTLIKQLVFAGGAVLLIPSCMQDKSKASFLLKNISINGSQENMLADIAETIIPVTDTPGAKDIGAHLFVLKMVDDCYLKPEQDKYLKGLKSFKKQVDEKYNKTFSKLSPVEREEFITALEAKKSGDEALNYFYNTTKKLTIEAYTTSKFYLTKVQVYQLVPGHFYGCVPVKSA